MMHAPMRVLPAQHMADRGEHVFVREFALHAVGIFLAQTPCNYIQHWDADSYQ
jgi:hypothetical protein